MKPSSITGRKVQETRVVIGFITASRVERGVEGKEKKNGERNMTDRRRYGVIEVRPAGSNCYHVKIGGELWAEVEWSRPRRAWCIQDAAGQCLTHVEHIVGQDKDRQEALRRAKRMIVDGSMPTPEEARQRLKDDQERKRLGEPFAIPPPGEKVTS
jgi:hypothetical protein